MVPQAEEAIPSNVMYAVPMSSTSVPFPNWMVVAVPAASVLMAVIKFEIVTPLPPVIAAPPAFALLALNEVPLPVM
ncbi:hypothetical protein R83H12_02236 [Fibrobacteria bacterium R8-3-H12]